MRGNMLKIDEILSNENQKNALEHFRTKRDGCGLDGMLLSELEEYWKINGECICEQIRKSEYRPGIVLIKEYIKRRLTHTASYFFFKIPIGHRMKI